MSLTMTSSTSPATLSRRRRRSYGESAQLLITPSSSQTVHHHRIGAEASAPTRATVIRPGQRLWAGRRRHGIRADPRITDLADGARPDNIAQMLRETAYGTRSVLWQAEKVTQVSDQHVATLYRRQAAAILPTDRRWLCLRSGLVMLRCTAKVLTLLRVSEPAIGEACATHWYAHLIRIDRRKCLLVTHAGTLFSVFMPNVTAAGLRPIGPPVVSAIHAALRAEGLPVDTLGDLDPQQVVVTKTADRRILGTINDLALTTEHVIASTGGLAHCDIDALHYGLHRTINSITGYIPPIELVAASHQSP